MRKLSEKFYLGIKRLNAFRSTFAEKGGKVVLLSCFLFFLFFLFLFEAKVYGSKGEESHAFNEKEIPSSLLIMDLQGESYAILVEKQTQKLFLYGCVAGEIELIKSFSCSTGRNSGDKKKRGDRKTPEGIYFFTRVLEDGELSPRYGVKAFVLDYPNFFDGLQKKGGRGIWLHGTNKTLMPNDSRGCIALNNQDLLELSKYISLYRTPIIILEKIEYLPMEMMEKRKRLLKTFIAEWLRSWEAKDLSGYMTCYAKDFRSKGMNWRQWKRYKGNLSKRNDKIKIVMDKLQGFTHNSYDLVTFLQDYHSDILRSKGIKRLFLREDGGELKIVGERWNPLRGGYLLSKEKPSAQVVSLKQEDVFKREVETIKAFVEQWRRHWENKALDEFMKCYAADFKAKDVDRKEWKELKRVFNQKYKNIKVNIINAEINIKERGDESEVSFIQHYQSDIYSDRGLKTLILKREEGEWQIVSEKWKPL